MYRDLGCITTMKSFFSSVSVSIASLIINDDWWIFQLAHTAFTRWFMIAAFVYLLSLLICDYWTKTSEHATKKWIANFDSPIFPR